MKYKRIYFWRGFDENHQFTKGEIAANSKNQAKTQLLLAGKIPTKIRIGPRLSGQCFDAEKLLMITKQLVTMLNAGLPLIETLSLIIKQQNRACWRLVLSEIQQKIIQGYSFSDAIKSYPYIFSSLYQQLIITGEITGQFTHCLNYILIQQENRIKLKKKIKKALRYPFFLAITTLLICIMIFTFVLPQFAQIYASFDAQLPYLTRLIILISHQLQEYGLIILCVICFSISLIRYFVYPKYRYTLQIWQLKTPILGDLLRNYHLALLFHTLFLTQKSGIPLLDGLISVTEVISFQAYQTHLRTVTTKIEQGLPLNQAMEQRLFYPEICQQFIATGEAAGDLDSMLEKLAIHYQTQLEEMTAYLSQKVEPMMMILIGCIIGGLIIAIYLPIFQLGTIL